LINWVEGPADIEGVGEQTIRLLWEKGLVRSLPDLYRLTKDQLLELDGFAEISATASIDAIQQSKNVPFSRVLLGLNIPKLGWVLAQSLARHFGNVDRLMAASQEEVEEVDGFGPDRAEITVEWFEDEQNRALVEELRSLGLRFELGEEDGPKEGPLTGKTYVITGTLERWSREQAAEALEAAGGKVTNSVSSKTTALIVGEEPGASKLTKAQKTGVELIDEATFEALLRS
jgi:DNA ligase (NAD+)